MGTETQRAKHNGILATKKGWAKEMAVETMPSCDQDCTYKRLEAEYQTAVDAYRVILMYAQATEEVTGKQSDEFTRAVFKARREMDAARGALNDYRRKFISTLW